MNSGNTVGYTFGSDQGYFASIKTREVYRNGERLASALTRLEFDILQFFLERPGELIHRSSLTPLNGVFRSGRHPTDDYISKINKKLGFEPGEVFESVRSVGYRLIGQVTVRTSLDEQEGSELYRVSLLHYNQHSVRAMRIALKQDLEAIHLNAEGIPQSQVDAALPVD